MERTSFEHLRMVDRDGITVVRLNETALSTERLVREIGAEILRLIGTRSQRLVIDLSTVDALSSAMIGKLVTIKRKVEEHKGVLALCGVSEELMGAFRVSRIQDYFTIHSDLDAALAAMRD